MNAVRMDGVIFNTAPVVKHLAGNQIDVKELEVVVCICTVDVKLLIQRIPVQAV